MKKVFSAGGIVIRRNNGKTEVAFIKDPYGKWAFPKGHLEKGEDNKSAALREVQEEMGCGRVKIKKYLGQMAYKFRDSYGRDGKKKELINKVVYYYLMEIPNGEKCSPQKDEGIEGIAWVDEKDAVVAIGYKNCIPILREAVREIKSIEFNS